MTTMPRTTSLVGWSEAGTRRVEVEVEIRDTDKGPEVSISGTAGRASQSNRNRGAFTFDPRFDEPRDYAGGQIREEVEAVTQFAAGWDAERRDQLVAVWHRWHLNGMRAGCEHQRAEGWDKRPIDPSKPTSAYGRHFTGQESDSWNLLGWVRPSEHPDGLLGRPCPVCDYEYGTAWCYEPVPADVIDFLRTIGAE